MAADATYHAARVYESVGFKPTEKLMALLRHGASHSAQRAAKPVRG
jgi:hypothetical protein